jgi:ATP-dependent DNA helicase RecG
VHGKVPVEERDATMEAFRQGRVHVLASTSLIEVGVDVPNASVMVVENAERFGLAQLHQLRGRIGRGPHESFCILVSDARDTEARARLEILAGTQDGFAIADADLQTRGPGDLLGQEQSGLPRLRFGDVARDLALIRQARNIVRGE